MDDEMKKRVESLCERVTKLENSNAKAIDLIGQTVDGLDRLSLIVLRFFQATQRGFENIR